VSNSRPVTKARRYMAHPFQQGCNGRTIRPAAASPCQYAETLGTASEAIPTAGRRCGNEISRSSRLGLGLLVWTVVSGVVERYNALVVPILAGATDRMDASGLYVGSASPVPLSWVNSRGSIVAGERPLSAHLRPSCSRARMPAERRQRSFLSILSNRPKVDPERSICSRRRYR
jgi:hypothetical protein